MGEVFPRCPMCRKKLDRHAVVIIDGDEAHICPPGRIADQEAKEAMA